MNLLARLRSMVRDAPAGSSITLPADWLRAELETESTGGDSGEPIPGDLTVEQVAAQTGRKPGAVRSWIRSGALRAYRFNEREYRVTPAALREYLEAQRGRETPGKTPVKRAARTHDLNDWRQVRKAG